MTLGLGLGIGRSPRVGGGAPPPPSPPAAPSGLVVVAVSPSQNDLTWVDNATTEDGFKVERSFNGTTWVEVADLAANTVSWSHTGRTEGTLHYYRVKAYNTGGDSAYSNTDSATTPLIAPSGLVATPTAPTSTRIDLSWTDNSAAETGQSVERSLTGTSGWTEIATPAANATTYSDTGLSPSTTYYYRVRATGAAASAYSSTANATTSAPAFSPTDIAGLRIWISPKQQTGYSDGDPVTTVTNFGNAGSSTLAKSGTTLTFETNEINGKPVLRFNNARLDVSGFAYSGSALTLVALVKGNAANANGLIDTSASAGNTVRAYNGFWEINSVPTLAQGVPAGTPYAIELRFTNADPQRKISARINKGTETTASNASATAFAYGNFDIGSINQTLQYFLGDLGDWMLYDSVLSLTDRDALADYLIAEYGIKSIPGIPVDSAVGGANRTNITLAPPGGTVAGDGLIAHIRRGDNTAGTISTPTGWTLLDSTSRSDAKDGWLFAKTAEVGDPANWNFAWTGNVYTAGSIYRVPRSGPSGSVTISTAPSVATYTGATTHTYPSITIPGADDWHRLIGIYWAEGAHGTTGDSAMTQHFSHNNTFSGTYAVQSQSRAAVSGATGTRVTTTGGGTTSVVHLLYAKES